jgi:hypothetical protein
VDDFALKALSRPHAKKGVTTRGFKLSKETNRAYLAFFHILWWNMIRSKSRGCGLALWSAVDDCICCDFPSVRSVKRFGVETELTRLVSRTVTGYPEVEKLPHLDKSVDMTVDDGELCRTVLHAATDWLNKSKALALKANISVERKRKVLKHANAYASMLRRCLATL